MNEPIRITAGEARHVVQEKGNLLVCANSDDERFKTMRLEGVIPYNEFNNLPPSLSKGQSIIFY